MWALMTSWCTPTTLFVVLNLMIGTIAVTSRLSGGNDRKYQHQGSPPLRRAPSLLERVKSFDFSLYRYEQQPPAHSEPGVVHPHLLRSPSLLERVRSFNFSLYGAAADDHQYPDSGAPAEIHDEDPAVEKLQPEPEPEPERQLVRTPSLLERMKSIKLPLRRSDPFPGEPTGGAPDRDTGAARKTKPAPEAAAAKRSGKLKKSVSQREVPGRDGEDADAVELRRPQTTRETKSKFSETMPFGEDEEVDARADDFINRFRQQLKLQRLDSLLRYSRGG